MSDTLQEQEDAILTTIRNSDDAQRNAVTTADYCDECKGRPHAPWCSLQRRCQHGLPVNDVCNECIEQAEFEASISEYQPAARGGSDGPERIWLQPGQALDPTECTLSHVGTERVTERDIGYVRMSQHQALVTEREQMIEALKGVAIMLNTQLEKYDKEPWAKRVRAAIALNEQRSTSE